MHDIVSDSWTVIQVRVLTRLEVRMVKKLWQANTIMAGEMQKKSACNCKKIGS